MNEIPPTYRWAERAETTVASPSAGTATSNVIQLSGGYGFPDEFPDIVAEAMAAAEARAEGLQYGPLYGLDDLRDEIVRYLAEDGIATARDNILVVNGAKQGLDLACRVFLDKGDMVIVTAPTYMTAVSILKAAEATFLSVPQDDDGIRVDVLTERLASRREAGLPMPKLLFDVPDFHNPTGITMTEVRRRRLVELAGEYDFVVIEDDPYRRIRFESAPVPPIKSFDHSGRVIGLGTASKILGPGLRIGWVNAAPDIIRRMAAHKSDGGSCPLMQRIATQLFQHGKVDQHVAALKATLHGHRDAMVSAIRQHMPGASVRVPNGGYFLWVELPQHIDADEVVRRAAKAGVAIQSGKSAFAEAPPSNFLRLAYSYCTPARIVEGIERVGRGYRALLAEAA